MERSEPGDGLPPAGMAGALSWMGTVRAAPGYTVQVTLSAQSTLTNPAPSNYGQA